MNFTPTAEQTAIVEASKNSKLMKIEARSGASKTSSLVMVANVNPEPSLYLAFNKTMADEAEEKFPNHVECRTVHSMAYRVCGGGIAHKLIRPKGGYVNVAGTPSEIAKYYGMEDYKCEGDLVFSAQHLGAMAKATVMRFEQSAEMKLDRYKHTPYYEIKEASEKYITLDVANVQRIVFEVAEALWADRIDPNSDVLATHDTYMKMFQMSKPKLDYGIIYVDEAQDVSDVMIDLVLRQKDHARLFFVGDSYQQIYAWRGAVNALAKIHGDTFSLSKSFRFGEEVAKQARAVLGEGVTLDGFEKLTSSVVNEWKEEGNYTMLFRTNIGLIQKGIELLSKGVKVNINVDLYSVKSMLESALALQAGNKKGVKHDKIIPYNSWGELMEASKHDADLNAVMSMCRQGSPEVARILRALQGHKNHRKPDVILLTAHRSKGLEFDTVVLGDDFPEYEKYKDNEGERNLLYVALTRAKKLLVTNSLLQEIVAMNKQNDEDYYAGEIPF